MKLGWSLILCIAGMVVPLRLNAALWYRAVSFAELGHPEEASVNERGQWVATTEDGNLQYFDGMQRWEWRLGAERIELLGFNAVGQVFGRTWVRILSQTPEGESEQWIAYPFFVRESRLTFWEMGPDDFPFFLSDRGLVIGTRHRSYDVPGGSGIGFVTDGSTWETFDADMRGEYGTYPGIVWPIGMNRAGTIVGFATFQLGVWLADFPPYGYLPAVGYFGFVREAGVLRKLAFPEDRWSSADRVNDAGMIVGRSVGDGTLAGFIASGRLMVRWPARYGSSLGINNAGVVVGQAAGQDDATPGPVLMWRAGAVSALDAVTDFSGTAASRVSSLVDIHDNGQIIVDAVVASGATRRFLLVPVQPSTPTRLANVSMRAPAHSGNATLIAGFVIAGGDGRILTRVVGPGLNDYGVLRTAPDPRLDVFAAGGTSRIASNDNWGDVLEPSAVASVAQRVGAFALGDSSKDAALLANLPAGAYTVHAGATATADDGDNVLSEVYDAGDAANSGRLVNASMRLWVGTGADIGILGFVLAGDHPASVLIRAIGPGLTAHNVSDVLADPQLVLYRDLDPMVSNDNWGTAEGNPFLADATAGAGTFALADGSKDAALVLQLEPGAYTVHVTGAGETTGVALVEIYLLP